MDPTNSTYYALKAAGSTFSTFKAYCTDPVCQSCPMSVPGIVAGACTNIDSYSVILAALNSTCLGGEMIVEDDMYVIAYTVNNDTRCSVSVSSTIEVLDLGQADSQCRNYTLGAEKGYASMGINGGNYNISYRCDVGCVNCLVSVSNYSAGDCLSGIAPGTNYKFVTGAGLNSCGQPTPSSSVVPSSSPVPTSTVSPTPTPTPTPYGTYSFSVYQTTNCALPKTPETQSNIVKLNSSTACVAMPNGLKGYYTLTVNSKNQATGTLFCNTTQCNDADCISFKDISTGVCVNDPSSQSYRLTAESQTCLGGADADPNVIYVVEYQPPDSQQVQSCAAADAAVINLLYLTTPDSICHPYTLNYNVDYVKIAPIAGKYNIYFGCNAGCTTCDVSVQGYSLGGCITQQPGVAYKFVQGSSINSCTPPTPAPAKKKGVNGAAIAGAVIGAVVILAGGAFIYFKYIRRRSAEYTPIS